MRDLRCAACEKLIARVSDDFSGSLFAFCRHCKEHTPYVTASDDRSLLRITCMCGKWLATGRIAHGFVRVRCRCGTMVDLTPFGPKSAFFEPPGSEADIVAMVEARWSAMRLSTAHRSADLAVGVRFDVFQRDGFRCRYCGRSPDDGALLEADHVIPRSQGGPDTLANLVTACWDCNRGKSAKILAS